MSHNNHETSTGASRILFLSSADGINLSGNPNLTTDFSFQLEQPIVVPHHHAILMSLHRTSIPHTFYNFQQFRNCAVNISLRQIVDDGDWGNDTSQLNITLEDGNYNAIDIVNLLTTEINLWLNGATKTQLGTITSPIQSLANGLKFFMKYNRSELKYEWILSKGTYPSASARAFLIFKWNTGTEGGAVGTRTNIQDEIGFIENTWVDGTNYDFFCQYQPLYGEDVYQWGALKNGGENGESDYVILKQKNGVDFPDKSYLDLTWSGNVDNGVVLPDGTTTIGRKSVFSCIDVNFHIRSLYIKTNLSQHSVLNSKHGGRFSSILARLPNDVSSGETLEVFPRDGIQHKLFLKVREIDKLFIRLTDLNNRLLNLNGLDWNLSLQFDFIELPKVKHITPDLRKQSRDNTKEKQLRTTGKKKELDEFLRLKEQEQLPNV